MTTPVVLGVLVSGRGTNLQAILDAAAAGRLGITPAVVVSNHPDAPALARAKAAHVPTAVVDAAAFASRAAFEEALLGVLRAHGVTLVALAGFDRLLGAAVLASFPQRIVNIHPALLPAFPGLCAQRQALQHSVKVSGCTVHIVDEGVDTGPIIVQAVVPVLDDDTEETLSARILVAEHRLYPAVLQWFVEGRVRVDGRQVRVEGARSESGAILVNPNVEMP